VVCLDLKTKGAGTSIVAREIALDVATSEYQPQIVEHIAGVDNVIADALSRKFMPGANFELPACLAKVPEATAPVRDRQYYRTTFKPLEAKHHNGMKRAASAKS
jgi:hypothetical protein